MGELCFNQEWNGGPEQSRFSNILFSLFMVHTRRNTDVPLTIPNFLARITPPRQTLAGQTSVASTFPFPSDSPISSILSSNDKNFRSFSRDMPDPADPANHTSSEASGSNNPTKGDSSGQ
ncbi:hypothetical protein PGT21_019781 [Puccinia graminis f. sp. tritici]|uniref:Uncharacterized protein n=1 Tax=Puccinia graminis f. sp. tritici TaxID=56615 RepID=A0A5B0QNH5_PUCGR|nr:hypothetical protein PGT21_019781 [Puccinia graminis f. sp. tritici]